MFSTTRDRKVLLESNIASVLSPHDVRIMKAVKLRKKERSSLLLLCIAVLLAATNTSSRARLRLGVAVSL
jgi:hypothetical protein